MMKICARVATIVLCLTLLCGFATQGRAADGAAPATQPAYRVLAVDKGHAAIVGADGKVEWEAPCNYTAHDLAVLPNGNYLINSGPATVVEMTPEKKIVWKYEAQPKAPYAGKVEVHACQRLADGTTMVSEAGNKRI